jgi:hypothetical protein
VTIEALAVVTVAFALGWMWRDHQLATRQVTYTDVYVQQKLSDRKFIMQPARMAVLECNICPESSVDWQEHETLTDWTFEQRQGCKRIISYHRPLKGESSARIELSTR